MIKSFAAAYSQTKRSSTAFSPTFLTCWESGKRSARCADQLVRQVFVKEKFHAGMVTSLRSRSAAKARHALMSSAGEIGKIIQYFLFGHPRGEVVENVIDGDTEPPDARLASAFAGLDCNIF